MRRVLLSLLAALAFTAGPAIAMELTPIPSSAAASDKTLWRQVMTTFYGKYDKTAKCWIGKASGKRYCMRPHTLHRISAGSATHYYLAIGGHPIEDGHDCHACPGTLGLFVLSDETRTLGIVARNSGYMEFGSWGTVPPEENVAVVRIGGPASFAWAIETGWMGHGIATTSISIQGVVGDQVMDLGYVPRSFSDEGNCENGVNLSSGEKCTGVSFEPVYNADGGTDRFGPIVVRGSGIWKGEPFNQSYTVTFDPQAMTYRIPPDFPEDFSP